MPFPAMRPWAVICLGVAVYLEGCASSDPAARAPEPVSPVVRLKIPRGHYPPAGECRVWIPGTPPGRQPAASACFELQGQVPPGAWVLYRPPSSAHLVEVTAYRPESPRVVQWVGYFEVASGRLVRRVSPP